MKKLVCIAMAAVLMAAAAACAPAAVSAPEPDPVAAPVEAAPTAAPSVVPEAETEPQPEPASPADDGASGVGVARGCPSGNAVQGGMAVQSGDALYYAGAEALYKQDTASGIAQSISEGVCRYLNAVGDTLWFVDHGDGLEQVPEIVSMSSDGSGKTELITGYADCLSVVGEYMYYLILEAADAGYCSTPYRAKLDGSDAQPLVATGTNYRFLNVVGDWAYFADYDPTQAEGHIYRVGVSGGEAEVIAETSGPAVNLVVAGDRLLYSAADAQGEPATFVCEANGSVLQQYELMSAVNADADNIYYVRDNADETQTLCRMDWEGGDVRELCQVSGAYQLWLTDGGIVYLSDGALYMAAVDGGQPTELMREEIEAEG